MLYLCYYNLQLKTNFAINGYLNWLSACSAAEPDVLVTDR